MATVENGSEKRELAGKRALVTGGSRGIGAGIVRHLLDAGAEVLTTARSAPGDLPGKVHFVEADLRTPEGIDTIAASAREVLGGVDILVSSAGGARARDGAVDTTEEVWQDTLNLNFLAAVRLDRHFIPEMRERGSGAIVHVASAATTLPDRYFLHYTAAKAALENYSVGLSKDLAPAGIRVNRVSPGRTATPGGEAAREEWAQMFGYVSNAVGAPPLGRDGTPDDIAKAVLFLVSDRANWISGANIFVDGGEFPRV